MMEVKLESYSMSDEKLFSLVDEHSAMSIVSTTDELMSDDILKIDLMQNTDLLSDGACLLTPSPSKSDSPPQQFSPIAAPPVVQISSASQDGSLLSGSPASGNKNTATFVLCRVCGDKASGYHYGVTSCEGCKGFFRRSIQKGIEYRCLRDGTCRVVRLNRNRCQYCRFKKCLAVGMSRDSVRYGRVPKGSRRADEQQVTTSGQAEQSAWENKQLAIIDTILTITQAHNTNCAFTQEKLAALCRKPVSLMKSSLSGEVDSLLTVDMLETQRLFMFQNLATLITPTISNIVEFAKRIPNFHQLCQEDQLILIKTGFFELWLTRLSCSISLVDNSVTFGDGSVVGREQLDLIYGEEIVTKMFEFAESFSTLKLTDAEIGLFSGVALSAADRQGLNAPTTVEKIQEQLTEALKLQVERQHSSEQSLYASLIVRLSTVRALSIAHSDKLEWFRERWAQLTLPPLLAEIYDIPKCAEDLL